MSEGCLSWVWLASLAEDENEDSIFEEGGDKTFER